MTRPIIGISMGDPAGVGPEIIAAALAKPEAHKLCRPLVVGDASVIRQATKYAKVALDVRGVQKAADAKFDPQTIDVFDLKNVELDTLQLGKVSAMAGNAAFEAVRNV